MERVRKPKSRRDKRGRKPPKVPILTYLWEDIRRAKRRGGYPWTHLYKPPFTEFIDPEQFTMEALRRSKSVSTVEVSNVEPSTEKVSESSRPESAIDKAVIVQGECEVQAESTESSDNISQYLDKDEAPTGSNEVNQGKKTEKLQRASSEEVIQRKRKLSAESGRSKYSLSQLGVMKKIHDARAKIKVPKIHFSKIRKSDKRITEKTSPPKEVMKNVKKTTDNRLKKDEKPVYIYIPLKPPSGETDEFSHLEFEDSQSPTTKNGGASEANNDNSPLTFTTKPPLKINPVFKQLLKDVRQLKQKEEIAAKVIEDESSKTVEKAEEPQGDLEKDEEQTQPDVKPVQPDEENNVRTHEEENIEHKQEEGTNEQKATNEQEGTNDQAATKIEDFTSTSEQIHNEPVMIPAPQFGEEQLDLEEQSMEPTDLDEPVKSKEDIFENLFQKHQSATITTTTAISNPRNIRSRSAEPQQPPKRRPSLESSYSHKSLRGIVKKLKEASGKIKKALSLSNLKRGTTEETKKKEETNDKPKKPKLTSIVKAGQLDKPLKPVQPVYIHIPLKPPEGQTDEFSYLEFENEPTTSSGVTDNGVNATDGKWDGEIKSREERIDSLDSTTPPNNDIQFIFLTPPSDDEILDEHDTPETPSSEDIVFFSHMKKLAKKVVDEVSPDAQRSALETVREESNNEEKLTEEKMMKKKKLTSDDPEQPQPCKDEIKEPEEHARDDKMVVDIEDGLNEPPKSDDLKSVIKNTSPMGIKKKVSFKRKTTNKKQCQRDDDDEYELIDVPKEVKEGSNNLTKKDGDGVDEVKPNEKKELIAGQSLSMEEEQRGYLDQKIMKDTSLEEDYKKWSKSGDHEYEPIDPPPEEFSATNFTTQGIIEVENDEPRFIISADEILKKPGDTKKKSSIFYFGKRQKEHDESSQRSSSESRSFNSQNIREVQGGEVPQATGGSFQAAIKEKTDRLKNKTHEFYDKICSIKKPTIQTPQFKRPEFSKRLKIKKPKLNLPKIPDTATFHLPTLKNNKKTRRRNIDIETKQLSTESNAGDSDTCLEPPRRKSSTMFDFTSLANTFPRLNKKKKQKMQEEDKMIVSFSTVPRTKTTITKETVIRIPLHSEESMESNDQEKRCQTTTECRDSGYDYNSKEEIEDESSHKRFDQSIVIDDDYEKENQEINQAEYLSRWQHGNFSNTEQSHVSNAEEQIVGDLVEERFKRISPNYFQHQNEILEEQLRRDESDHQYIEEYTSRQPKEIITDLDNLDEDEHEEGEDEEITGHSSEGSYNLYHKGRLGKIDINSDEFFVVHEIQEGFQTPANTLAQMNEYDLLGSQRSLSEVPVKRKPIKKPKRKKTPHGSQEHIHKDTVFINAPITDSSQVPPIPPLPPSRPKRRSKKIRNRQHESGFVPYQETIYVDRDEPRGTRLDLPRESLGILGDDERDDQDFDYRRIPKEEPRIPPRQRSLKSLNQSENEFINTPKGTANSIEDYIIPNHQIESAPPKRPGRKLSQSLASSLSRASLPPSQRDVDSLIADETYLMESQVVPDYLMEHENKPCVEEPCVQDIRDYMGYAIIGKNKPVREPPLPPRRHKRQISPTEKFATVPRCYVDSPSSGRVVTTVQQPTRPLRNYSTIGHSATRNGQRENLYENDQENKENEESPDISQYIEIERDLISGEVVQKMRQRPLPPPPRPPRTSRKSLQDITFKENIVPFPDNTKSHQTIQEETVSTQTEPLPADFVCEEIRSDPNDTILLPRNNAQSIKNAAQRRAELITPSVYTESYQETVTHGSLLVEPLNGATLLQDKIAKERVVPVTREFTDDGPSKIPSSFEALTSNPPQIANPEKSPSSASVIKADKLEIADLDVDRLQVNELLANKILVSEIESSTIQADELLGKSGSIKGSNIILPSNLIEEIVKKLRASVDEENVEKKTPTNERQLVDVDSAIVDVDDQLLRTSESAEPNPPEPPPRIYTFKEDNVKNQSKSPSPPPLQNVMVELEIDDQLPPRPPQPAEGVYIPSQPPASFYELRAKQYIDEMNKDNIPTVPKRKKYYHRKNRSRPVSRSRSNSDDSSVEPVPPARSQRLSRHEYCDASIPELTGKLFQACSTRTHSAIQRLIYNLTENVLKNADGKQDLYVFTVILLVLIIGLILLSIGDEKTIVHLHHWDHFNPPID